MGRKDRLHRRACQPGNHQLLPWLPPLAGRVQILLQEMARIDGGGMGITEVVSQTI